MSIFRNTLLFATFCLFHISSKAQNQRDISQAVMLNAAYQSSGDIHLFWDTLNESFVELSYRFSADDNWQRLADSISIDKQPYIIAKDAWENGMEIRVMKDAEVRAFGFMQLGWEWEKSFRNKELIILIHETIADSISTVLEEYMNILRRERWNIRAFINSDTTAVDVKKKIIDLYEQQSINALMLIGDIPVPLSGDRAIDGHNNHVGAWSSDSYYADLDGNWTDTRILDTSAARMRNHNIPGDGKFDQRIIPSEVELAVGRVDFSDMPAFNTSEVELTIAYLEKNIAYRKNEILIPKRGMIHNRFGLAEGFGQSAVRSYSTLMHHDSIHFNNFKAVTEQSYLWSYGAGGGNYKGASGIINTNQLVSDSIQTIFNALFGSYFGDYDVQDNLLRAAIGSGTTLVTSWSGRPLWEYHKMAMGETIGDVLMQTQNDNFTYPNGIGWRGTHIALIGDPTLKQDYFPLLEFANVRQMENDIVLDWDAMETQNLLGYYVYYALNDGPIVRLTETFITENYYSFCPSNNGTYTIFISPVFLNRSPSGSFLDEGLSYLTTITIDNRSLPMADFNILTNGLEINFENNSTNGISFQWLFGDGNSSSEESPIHVYENDGKYTVSLIAVNGCLSDTLQQDIDILLTHSKDQKLSLHIYPNPTFDQLYVKQDRAQLPYSIYDLIGNSHLSGTVYQGLNTINVESLMPGPYFLIIDNEILSFHKY